MAGSASNWFRPSSGPLAGQSVYIERVHIYGGLSRSQIEHGLNTSEGHVIDAARRSIPPLGTARTRKPGPDEVYADAAIDLIMTNRRLDSLDKTITQLESVPKSHRSARTYERIEKLNAEDAKLLRQRNKLESILEANEQPAPKRVRRVDEFNTGDITNGQDYVREAMVFQAINDDQHRAMDTYIENSYQINNGLRTGNLQASPPMVHADQLPPRHRQPRDVRKDVAALDSMVQTIQPYADVAVFRGMDGRFLDRIRPGMELRDTGFMSMSFDRKTADHFAREGLESIDATAPLDRQRIPTVLQVNLRPGNRVVPTIRYDKNDATGQSSEFDEILLDRETTLTVSHVTEQNGVLVVTAEITGQRS